MDDDDFIDGVDEYYEKDDINLDYDFYDDED